MEERLQRVKCASVGSSNSQESHNTSPMRLCGYLGKNTRVFGVQERIS